jgi:hypothetical protein
VTKREAELVKWKADKEEVGKKEIGEDDWADGSM